MASWMPENQAARVIAYHLSEGPFQVVLFSTSPTPEGAATDGVEASTRQPATVGVVTDATGARIKQVALSNVVSWDGILVASDEISGLGIFDTAKGEFIHIEDGWRPRKSFAVGGSFRLDPGDLVIYGARA